MHELHKQKGMAACAGDFIPQIDGWDMQAVLASLASVDGRARQGQQCRHPTDQKHHQYENSARETCTAHRALKHGSKAWKHFQKAKGANGSGVAHCNFRKETVCRGSSCQVRKQVECVKVCKV